MLDISVLTIVSQLIRKICDFILGFPNVQQFRLQSKNFLALIFIADSATHFIIRESLDVAHFILYKFLFMKLFIDE